MIVTSNVNNNLNGVSNKIQEIHKVELKDGRVVRLYKKATVTVDKLNFFGKEENKI